MSYSDVKDILSQLQTDLQGASSTDYAYLGAIDNYNILMQGDQSETFRDRAIYIIPGADTIEHETIGAKQVSNLEVMLLVPVKGFNSSELITALNNILGDIIDLLMYYDRRKLTSTADWVTVKKVDWQRYKYEDEALRWVEITINIRRDHTVS